MSMRERIYQIVEQKNHDRLVSSNYDMLMLFAIAIGIIPLMFREHYRLFWFFDLFSGICFIVDYIFRWVIADYDSKRKGWRVFVIYPSPRWPSSTCCPSCLSSTCWVRRSRCSVYRVCSRFCASSRLFAILSPWKSLLLWRVSRAAF